MLGVLTTLAFCAFVAGLAKALLRSVLADLDPAAALGISGLVGLGSVGTFTLFIGLLPGGLSWGPFIVGALALGGLVAWIRGGGRDLAAKVPRDVRLAAIAFFVLAGTFALAGVLAPSDTVDWDTVAYHLAVPKIWLAAGQIQYVSFIHHSNFPFAIDNLYIWGLTWGGESGAKAFSLAFYVFGGLSIFGLTRTRYGEKAAYWAGLAFASTPMVVWLSGTGYIDVGNGLYGGLGILLAAAWIVERKRNDAILAGILIGLCAGSKYTGLQILICVIAVVVVRGLIRKQVGDHVKCALLIAGLAGAIACPWYIKNVVNTGNPVYPFFYSIFGGKNWDAFSEKIYKEQQQTFGMGREMVSDTESDYLAHPLDPGRIGNAVLGLAYQPGRYIDPQPTRNGGFFFGALGFVALAGGLFWMFSGETRSFEGAILGAIGIALLMWFGLSEQSRYILGLTVPLCVLAGGAIARLRGGLALAVGAVIQAVACLYVVKAGRLDLQLQVITGKVAPSDYQTQLTHFYEPAQWINANVKGKVALYDEVFGYLLDVPYFWAGPGHTTEIGYEKLADGAQLVSRLHELGMTHAYIDLSTTFGGDHAERDRWIAAAGLQRAPQPYTPTEVAEASGDIRHKYKVLLAQAIAAGLLKPIKNFGTRFVFEIAN